MVADQLSATFAALADPTRRAILSRLTEGERSVKELAEPFRMSLPAVSKHLKTLERAGLIERSRNAQWRPCRLKPEALKGASDWIEQYRRLWEERFDRLDAYLQEVQARQAAETPSATVEDAETKPPGEQERSDESRKRNEAEPDADR